MQGRELGQDQARQIEQDRLNLFQLKKVRELKKKQINADKQFAYHEMKTLQKEDLKLVKVYTKKPPEVVASVMTIVIVLFQQVNKRQDIWKQILNLLGDTQTDQCTVQFHNFDAENLPREVLYEVEAMIEDTGYDFSYEHFQNTSKVAAKFVQWINGVITIARCRYMLDDLLNNINKLELKIKKFGKQSGLGMQEPGFIVTQGNRIYMSPRRGSTDGKSLSPGKKTSMKKAAKKKGGQPKVPEKPQIKYPYDDRLPSMISESIDDFICQVAEKKARQLCDDEVSELSEEVKHQMTMSKEMNINKVDGTFYNHLAPIGKAGYVAPTNDKIVL